jgi:hypothetical protein
VRKSSAEYWYTLGVYRPHDVQEVGNGVWTDRMVVLSVKGEDKVNMNPPHAETWHYEESLDV